MSMSNMAMLVGKLGRRGLRREPAPWTEQCTGSLWAWVLPPTDFPGYQKVAATGVVEKFEKAWGVPLNHNVGTHATDVFPKAITQEISCRPANTARILRRPTRIPPISSKP